MAVKTSNGFQLCGHLGGGVHPPSHRYQKSVGGGQDSVVYVGDPVALTSAGTVTRLHANTSTAGGAASNNWFLGVCTGIYEDQSGRPLTSRVRKYSATADAAWIDVIDDPDAVWEVSYTATANQTVLGSLAYVAYVSANTAAGISGAGLNGAHPAASTVSTPFKIIGINNLNLDGFTNDQDGRVRVVCTNHVLRANNSL